mmetsp:Transcript_490/g.1158  ORF Transcript_490/g.1158 Transcript_490/m.1158 type:complete len:425 (-) Transcript_490:109-1383(-)
MQFLPWLYLGSAAALDDSVDLCGHSASLCGVTSYAGHVPVAGAGSIFYWYFTPEQLPKDAPVVLWLQGGPGASSMLGALFEHGPLSVDEEGVLHRRPASHSWVSVAPVLYLDSPVGTGLSFAEGDQGYARSQADVSRTLATVLDRFRILHPEAPRRFLLAGESYGGHFIPALASYLLDHPGSVEVAGVMVGDGLTDPAVQVLQKPASAFQLGLIDEKQYQQAQGYAELASKLALAGNFSGAASARAAMEELVEAASQVTPYDVRDLDGYAYQDQRMGKLFADSSTRALLHIPANVTWGEHADVVKQHLQDDIMRSQKPAVERLLEAGVQVLLYQGQFDWKDGVVSNEAWIRSMNWTGAVGYLQANRSFWRRAADGRLAGYWRGHRNLHQVVVLGAGHMVPMNQPESAVDLLRRFLGILQRQALV